MKNTLNILLILVFVVYNIIYYALTGLSDIFGKLGYLLTGSRIGYAFLWVSCCMAHISILKFLWLTIL